jgi:hypothetical protein
VSCIAVWADEQNVVVVEGTNMPATVQMDELVRITAAGIAGAQISAQVEGAGTLAATYNIRRQRDGQPVIGNTIKDFVIKPEKKGTITVTVTVKNPTNPTPLRKEYVLHVK